MDRNEPQDHDRFNMQGGMNVLYLIASALAACLWPLLRHSCGTECPGLAGLFALGFMLFYAADSRDPLMSWWIIAWLVALVWRRLETWRLVRLGLQPHSRYTGVPWLVMKIPFVRSEGAARNLEVSLCLAAAIAVFPASPALGRFLLYGALGLGIVRAFELQVTSTQLRRMRDAEIEQKNLMDLYRNRRDY